MASATVEELKSQAVAQALLYRELIANADSVLMQILEDSSISQLLKHNL